MRVVLRMDFDLPFVTWLSVETQLTLHYPHSCGRTGVDSDYLPGV